VYTGVVIVIAEEESILSSDGNRQGEAELFWMKVVSRARGFERSYGIEAVLRRK